MSDQSEVTNSWFGVAASILAGVFGWLKIRESRLKEHDSEIKRLSDQVVELVRKDAERDGEMDLLRLALVKANDDLEAVREEMRRAQRTAERLRRKHDKMQAALMEQTTSLQRTQAAMHDMRGELEQCRRERDNFERLAIAAAQKEMELREEIQGGRQSLSIGQRR